MCSKSLEFPFFLLLFPFAEIYEHFNFAQKIGARLAMINPIAHGHA